MPASFLLSYKSSTITFREEDDSSNNSTPIGSPTRIITKLNNNNNGSSSNQSNSIINPNVPISIPAHQTHKLILEFFSKHVNLDYKKEITIKNLYNDKQKLCFDVYASILDQYPSYFHSQYYKIITQFSFTNEILNFDTMAINSKSLRRFKIENITNEPIRLYFEHNLGNGLHIYVKGNEMNCRTPISPNRYHKRIKEQVVDELTSAEEQQQQRQVSNNKSLTVEFHDRKQENIPNPFLSPRPNPNKLTEDVEFDELVKKYTTVYITIIIIFIICL